MKLSQLIKMLAICAAMSVSPLYADCSACDSDNPDSNAETQQEPDETTNTTDSVNAPAFNNATDSYYLKNSSYSSATTDQAQSSESNNNNNNSQQ